MSHQVLARKWRPQSFGDIVGQEHVVRALMNALKANRLHHAYLFSGTRGVGKTTIARILAKALNCEQGISDTPCGTCTACQEISEGRSVDLIEVDAASRTKVEDTRELLDNVQYAPTRSRFKVYLIDEVHMLSGHSFNALLKTLEEPPEHVKFLLATTDPQKLPVTVLSRCLQFNLTHLSVEQISRQLNHVLQHEGVTADDLSVHLIARAADGSMRDALSLLDQALAYTGADLSEEAVSQMLGMAPRSHYVDLVQSIAARDAKNAMHIVERLAQLNISFVNLLEEVGTIFHAAAMQQKVPGLESNSLYPDLVTSIGECLTAEDIQLHYQFVMRGLQDIHQAHSARAGFEMVILRMMLFRPDEPAAKSKARRSVARVAPKPEFPSHSSEAQVEKESDLSHQSSQQDWAAMVRALNANGVALALAEHSALKRIEEQRIVLELSREHESLKTKNATVKLTRLLSNYLGREVRLEIETVTAAPQTAPANEKRVQQERKVDHARESILEDEFVRGLQSELQAELIPDSIKANSERGD